MAVYVYAHFGLEEVEVRRVGCPYWSMGLVFAFAEIGVEAEPVAGDENENGVSGPKCSSLNDAFLIQVEEGSKWVEWDVDDDTARLGIPIGDGRLIGGLSDDSLPVGKESVAVVE